MIDERTLEDYRVMMADPVRMRAYSRAIEKVAPGRLVADLGAGLGPLGLMALRSGARRVYAIEMDPQVLAVATLAARRAGYGPDRFVPVAGRSDEIELPEPVDVVVSETVDGIGEGENTAYYLEDARRRLLRPGGVLVPQRLESFVAVAASEARRARRHLWDSELKLRYGLDYTPILDELMGSRATTTIQPEELLTDWARWVDLDFQAGRPPDRPHAVEWTTVRAGHANGLAFAFRMQLVDDVAIDTRPHHPRTHWEQGWIDLPSVLALPEGLRLRAVLELDRSDQPWLALRTTLDAVESEETDPIEDPNAWAVDRTPSAR